MLEVLLDKTEGSLIDGRAVRIIDGSVSANAQFRRLNVRGFPDETPVERFIRREDVLDPF